MEYPVDDDDIIPDTPKAVGRRVRPLSDPMSRGSAAHAPKCRECPKRECGRGVCSVRGAYQPGGAPACRYGIVLIRAKRMANRRARPPEKEE